MTPEQAATLEAAIGPLSAPAPNREGGETDLRPAGQRRVEALTEVCRRGSIVAAEGSGAVAGSAVVLHVTVPVTDLASQRGAGEVLGTVAGGTLLPPAFVRRLACDATLVTHLLGGHGEPLALSRAQRLFSRGQRRHLGLRDRGCTFPGCTAPASWCEAHHVIHWADGGATDVTNAALLCARHHHVVHRRRLVAEVRRHPDDRGRHVVWDLADGSYDRAVSQAPPLAAPPPRSPFPDPEWAEDDDLPWFDPPFADDLVA
ncbi:HNH endonuclease signature motif containing protein [Phycicoccus sp. HDW14]|uniref:HNH endonuclease signature motif containing protein n=1 Tax=Phycicoccus sp. HDW14 TaxID=2714941 RepID=UPI001F0DEF11|nr:HNH endonuclease signature motif containing protein [Phycicoccus sp. HDW14]